MGLFDGVLDRIGYEPKEKKKKEDFKIKRVFDDMVQEGFRLLIKNDILMQRNQDIKEDIAKIQFILDHSKTDEDKKTAVTMAYALIHHASVSWLRIMENTWLGTKVTDFFEQYVALHDLPEYYEDLVNESKAIISIFSNVDVEPLRPLVIQSFGKGVNPRNPSSDILGGQ